MDCGGCQYFKKWKADKWGEGICKKQDARTYTDYGVNCPYWKAIPYNRIKEKKRFKENRNKF